MKGKLVYARKTSGGRCCLLKHKSVTSSTHKSHRPKEDKEQAEQTVMNQIQGTSIKTVTNKHIPSNAQVQAQKPKMDAFAKKLESIKLKKRNITFSL